jgi:glycine cleavage system transcriptional repressor
MTHHAILTATGPDRPGLVDEVSQFLFECGANIEDSRMVNLRGHFAMVVRRRSFRHSPSGWDCGRT